MAYARTTAFGIGCGALATLAALAAAAQQHESVELRGSRLSVERTVRAADCPGQDAIVERVQEHLTQGGGQPEGPLDIQAVMDAHGDELVARIVVTGHREGQRVLRAPGPACDELADALAVSLALILDGTMTRSLEPLEGGPSADGEAGSLEPVAEGAGAGETGVEATEAGDSRVPETPAPGLVDEARAPSQNERSGSRAPARRPRSLRGWVAGGGGVTYGVPGDASGAATLSLGVELGRWSAVLGAFWTPTHRFERSPGEVAVRLLGGTARGCARLVGGPDTVRGHACLALGLGALRGKGEGDYRDPDTATHLWAAGGVAIGARGTIVGRLGWDVGGTLLVPIGSHEFLVLDAPDPVAFSSRPVALFGVGQLTFRFP